MSKERLEEIKKELELDWSDISYVVNQNDVKWLVNRVEELEEALEFYAEKSNYDYDVKVDSISYVGDQSDMKFYRLDSKILNDKGKKARQALEGEE